MQKKSIFIFLFAGILTATGYAQQNKTQSKSKPVSTNNQTTNRVKKPVTNNWHDDSLMGVKNPSNGKTGTTTTGNHAKTTPPVNRTKEDDSLETTSHGDFPLKKNGTTGTLPVKKTGTRNN